MNALVLRRRDRRLGEHRSGTGSKLASESATVELIYAELFGSRAEALKREGQLKGWSRCKKPALVTGRLGTPPPGASPQPLNEKGPKPGMRIVFNGLLGMCQPVARHCTSRWHSHRVLGGRINNGLRRSDPLVELPSRGRLFEREAVCTHRP